MFSITDTLANIPISLPVGASNRSNVFTLLGCILFNSLYRLLLFGNVVITLCN